MTSESFCELFLDGCRGIYIPRDFAAMIALDDWNGIYEEQLSILKRGPDHENYFDVWDEILDYAETKKDGGTLYQDGDLWLIRTQAAIDTVNNHCAMRLEYEESHEDAGNEYAYMVPDYLLHQATKDDSFPALTKARLEEKPGEKDFEWIPRYSIDTKGLDQDALIGIALECFEMSRGSIFGPYCNDSAFPIASFPIKEIEIELDSLGIEGLVLDIIRESCDPYISEEGYAYMTTDSVWYAMVPVEVFQTAINQYVEESVA